MKIFSNPIAFTPLPVTIITLIVYAALIIPLLVTHLVVPEAPRNWTPFAGVNLTEAWQDLQRLSTNFHPFNSRKNDGVRDWLLTRIENILQENGISSSAQTAPVVVFSDIISNLTFSLEGRLKDAGPGREPGHSVYFEGTNIIVYIRGSEDEPGDWWTADKKAPGKGGVLINAHYDSVSTGFGATDDGVGVVTILQLVKHFTSSGQQPRKGVVALFNNGEEDYLHGARAFTRHPMSRFAHTFVNLDGAGAGGRATLLRATDTEIVQFYQQTMYPFATILTGDAFKRGLIRSQTDYIIFNEVLGLRGLDIDFMEPRARYHTEQDDTKHTSIDSLWHMLSATLSTVQGLASDTSSTFDGKSAGNGKVSNGEGSDAVYFDLFSRALAVFRLQNLFALSVTLLTVAPLILIIIGAILLRVDKLYLFSASKHPEQSEWSESVSLKGWRGIFRAPSIFVLASAGVVGLAFLMTKVNPYIIYSSPYAVWSMMISAWFFITWFFSRAADFTRPTALHRAYALLWMFAGGWLALVVATVFEQRQKIGGVYFIVFYFAAIFLATAIALLELFGLPRKSEYAMEIEQPEDRPAPSLRSGSISSGRVLGSSTEEQSREATSHSHDDEDVDATESTSLLRGDRPTTFAHYTSPHSGAPEREPETVEAKPERKVFGEEQAWSWALPTWTWLLQFLLLAPIVIVLVGQISLLAVSGTYQTLADGNSILTVYIALAVFTILIFAPLGPFIHRYTYHIPTFLLLVFVGTLIYNLVAFPFSANNRLKLGFIQKVDLDTGLNKVSLTGIGGIYLDATIQSLPSVAGQQPECSESALRTGLTDCTWNGLPPRVVKNILPGAPPSSGYANWLSFNVMRSPNRTEAHFRLWGRDTRACKIQFDRPIFDFHVDGAAEDQRFSKVPEGGSKEIRLWSRTWENTWSVTVRWRADRDDKRRLAGLDGRVVCLWSDENETGVIPALDEIRHFAPDWVAITKSGDGLVEGSKAFLV
ncbi:hypothetical protein MMC07_002984 [Pseudocyphellaria aurata]|nr:hypothetical protein [Pseudocyphellaria aurata]